MERITKNSITMEGSGSGDSIVTVTAPFYTGRPYQQAFKIQVNENLFRTVTVIRGCKANFDLALVLNQYLIAEKLLDSENYELLDSENYELYSKGIISEIIQQTKYETCKIQDIDNFQDTNYAGWSIVIKDANNNSLGSGITDANGRINFFNISFANNSIINVIATKNSDTKSFILSIDNFDEAYILYI